MKGLDDPANLIGLIISNGVAILFLISAIYWPKISRLLFFFLFSWACWMNWKTSQQDPIKYLEFADLTFSTSYRTLIKGWFSQDIQLAVGFIATSQGLIAISMLLKNPIFKIGAMGAILFLLAILPLGVGSGFPCTLIFSIAMYILLRKESGEYLWKINKPIIV